jgi:hypothetical protein
MAMIKPASRGKMMFGQPLVEWPREKSGLELRLIKNG